MDKWEELKQWARNKIVLGVPGRISGTDIVLKMQELENPKILVDRQVILNAIEYVGLLRSSLLREAGFDSMPLKELEDLLK